MLGITTGLGAWPDNRLTARLVGRLTARLVGRLTARLWLVARCWLDARLAAWCWLVAWLAARLWLVAWLAARLAAWCWLVAWLDARLAARLVGWLDLLCRTNLGGGFGVGFVVLTFVIERFGRPLVVAPWFGAALAAALDSAKARRYASIYSLRVARCCAARSDMVCTKHK